MKLFCLALMLPVATPALASSLVTCASLNAPDAFTIEFVSHPRTQELILATFRDATGKTLEQWAAPINGIAQRGFIKINRVRSVGRDTRLVTAVLADHVGVAPNEPFAAEYLQFTRTPGLPNQTEVRYSLSCRSPD